MTPAFQNFKTNTYHIKLYSYKSTAIIALLALVLPYIVFVFRSQSSILFLATRLQWQKPRVNLSQVCRLIPLRCLHLRMMCPTIKYFLHYN